MTTPIFVLASALPGGGFEGGEATLSALAELGAMPASVAVVVPGLGEVALSFLGLGCTKGVTRVPDGPSFGLGRGAAQGRLSLDGAFARRLVARALGVESEGAGSVRRMGLGERGLLAGMTAAILHELQVPLAVSVAAPAGDELRAARCVGLEIAVDVAGATGHARLEVPSSWLEEAAARDELRTRLATLRIEACVERAATLLATRALDELEPGDAVVFAGERPSANLDDVWPARVVIGAYVARADVELGGQVILRGNFERAAMTAGARSRGSALGNGRELSEQTVVLADAEVRTVVPGAASERIVGAVDRETMGARAAAPAEVIAEIGRVVLGGDEVLGLAPGSMLALDGPRSTLVALRVAEAVRAEGALVDIDGELAVHVTKIFPR